MRRLVSVALTLASIALGTAARAQTLPSASNDQILDELRRRLEQAGPVPTPNPILSATCVISGPTWVLRVSSLTNDGDETVKEIATRSNSRNDCNRHLGRFLSLGDASGHIRSNAEFSLCFFAGPTWVLSRIFLRTDGAVNDLPPTDTGSNSLNDCRPRERPQ